MSPESDVTDRTPPRSTMSKRTSKRRARKKSGANHGKRPNA